MPLRINLWSGPRCASTALMYSFKARGDAAVVDEPFYAWYLAQHPLMRRPYREELLRSMDTDWERVRDSVILGPVAQPVLFLKHIASMTPPNLDWICQCRNVILIRPPADVLASYTRAIGLDDVRRLGAAHVLGLRQQVHLLETFGKEQPIPVISNATLLARPEGTLRALCQALDLDFVPRMLTWEKGGIPEDGLWAKHWYTNTHASTGFQPEVQTPSKPVPEELRPFLDECLPLYRRLEAEAMQPLPVPDPRNADLQVYVNGRLVHRDHAAVSVFDSAVQAGDAVWEGLRVTNGKVFALEEHLARLLASARALAFRSVPAKEALKEAVMRTLEANGMRDGALVRLTLTRGPKVTSGMSPKNNQSAPTLIVLAEWKSPTQSVNWPLRLITSAVRRNTPACLDSKIHHTNLLNNVLAKIQADNAGVEDALMLDVDGYVAETNSMNFFVVKDGVLYTPPADHCLPGITRGMVVGKVAPLAGVECREVRLSLTDVWTADEAFTTGTMGGLAPVVEVDGRRMTTAPAVGPVTQRLRAAYAALQEREGVPLPF
eukprot:EG_transcript_5935